MSITKISMVAVMLTALVLGAITTPQRSEAWSPDSAANYNLPLQFDDSLIFNEVSPIHIGVSITATTGTVALESWQSGLWSTVATVEAGQSHVAEGTWKKVRVINQTVTPATGNYEIRENTGTHHRIGGGSVTLSGSPIRVFKASLADWRDLVVTADTDQISLRTSQFGGDIITIDPGDSAAIKHSTDEFWITGAAGTILFEVAEAKQNPWSEWLKVKKNGSGDTHDRVHKQQPSSTTCHDYEVKNTDNKVIKVRYRHQGGAVEEESIDPGEVFAFNCCMAYVEIVYPDGGGDKAEWRYRKH